MDRKKYKLKYNVGDILYLKNTDEQVKIIRKQGIVYGCGDDNRLCVAELVDSHKTIKVFDKDLCTLEDFNANKDEEETTIVAPDDMRDARDYALNSLKDHPFQVISQPHKDNNIVLVKDGNLIKGDKEKLEHLGYTVITYKHEKPEFIEE